MYVILYNYFASGQMICHVLQECQIQVLDYYGCFSNKFILPSFNLFWHNTGSIMIRAEKMSSSESLKIVHIDY